MIAPWVSPVCRAVFAAFSGFTSLYCVLAYLPFTYHQIHQGGLFPVLDRFRDAHPFLNVIASLAAVPVWLPAVIRRRGALGRYCLALGFLVASSAWMLYLLVQPALAALDIVAAEPERRLALLARADAFRERIGCGCSGRQCG